MKLKIKEEHLKTGDTLKQQERSIKAKKQMQRAWIKVRKGSIDQKKLQHREAGNGEQKEPVAYAEDRMETGTKRALQQGKYLAMDLAKSRIQKKRALKKDYSESISHQSDNPIYIDNMGSSIEKYNHKAKIDMSERRIVKRENLSEYLSARKKFQRRRQVHHLQMQRVGYGGRYLNRSDSVYSPQDLCYTISSLLKNPFSGSVKEKRKHAKSRIKRYKVPVFSYMTLAILILIIIIILAASMAFYGSEEGDIPVNGSLVEIAESQLGNVGGVKFWSWYGFQEHVDWCACFVSWCCDKAGYLEDGRAPKFSYCQDGVNWFISQKNWYRNTITPKPGMIIFFDWDRNGEANHVGIVKECRDGIVYTIEGNSGDMCRERSYPVGSSLIYGYGAITTE